MINVIFVCHGNICRSPVGEVLFNIYAKERHLDSKMHAISRAISSEEIGNDIYYPMKEVLKNNNIYPDRHCAKKNNKRRV